jgi:DNA-binding XRE family transcriptional regulator
MPTRNTARNDRRRRRTRREMNAYGSAADASFMSNARQALGFSQAEMGEALGLTQGAVSHIETKDRPLSYLQREKINQLLAMQSAIGLSMEASPALGCPAQTHMDHVEYAAHLLTCSTCIAKAIVMRRVPVR